MTRTLVGAALFATTLAAPFPSAKAAPALLAALLWVGAAALPRRVIGAALTIALISFGPYALLAVGAEGGAVAARIAVRGAACMLVSIATAATLELAELHAVAARLLPQPAAAILVQIVHQAGTLAEETARIAAAIRLRTAAGGLRTTWLVIASLPHVWLPRVLARAERVATAMELRGYHGQAPAIERRPPRALDVVVLAASVLTLGATVALRAGRAP
jgi:energy-coupling factor transporter transmembrane protein EcfT